VLKAIDGISLQLCSNLAEVYQLLRSECPLLRLEVLPSALASQLATKQQHTAALGVKKGGEEESWRGEWIGWLAY